MRGLTGAPSYCVPASGSGPREQERKRGLLGWCTRANAHTTPLCKRTRSPWGSMKVWALCWEQAFENTGGDDDEKEEMSVRMLMVASGRN